MNNELTFKFLKIIQNIKRILNNIEKTKLNKINKQTIIFFAKKIVID